MSGMTITEFLLARIAEDEQDARFGGMKGEAWTLCDVEGAWETVAVKCVDTNEEIVYNEGRPTLDQARHIARHDPARVVAECEAKRRIVGLHPEILGICQGCASEMYPCRTLRALASAYTDHPDFQQEWRVA